MTFRLHGDEQAKTAVSTEKQCTSEDQGLASISTNVQFYFHRSGPITRRKWCEAAYNSSRFKHGAKQSTGMYKIYLSRVKWTVAKARCNILTIFWKATSLILLSP